MDEEKVLSSLRRNNPWWSGKEIDLGENYYQRSQYYFLKEQINEEEITGILGPRRVGKTTILKQTAEHLMEEEGVSSERVLFVQLDNPYLKSSLEEPLKDILEVYQEYILEESFENLESTVYIFLDEIQVLEKWAEKLKYWYDLNYDLKFAITGSSSAKITAGSESLLGRIIDRKILPLKFSETLRMKREVGGLNLETNLRKNKHIMKNSFKKAVREGSPDSLKKTITKNKSLLSSDKPKIKPEVERYIKRGGYPKIIQKEIEDGVNPNYASQKLENDAEKAIQKDASDIYDVQPSKLMKIMVFIADNTAQKLIESSLADFANVSPKTAGKYVDYLEDAYLIHRNKFYSKSKATSENKKQKAYVWDPGFRNAISGSLGGDYTIDSGEKGLIVESICADHVKRLCFNLTQTENKSFYWDYNNGEVDLILEIFDSALPVEVKCKNNISKTDLRGLNRFLYDHNDSKFGIVITEDKTGIVELKNGKAVLFPLWTFLTMI